MLVPSGACRVASVMTCGGEGIQEQEPGWEDFCEKADLKVSCGIKRKPFAFHVCKPKNNRLMNESKPEGKKWTPERIGPP